MSYQWTGARYSGVADSISQVADSISHEDSISQEAEGHFQYEQQGNSQEEAVPQELEEEKREKGKNLTQSTQSRRRSRICPSMGKQCPATCRLVRSWVQKAKNNGMSIVKFHTWWDKKLLAARIPAVMQELENLSSISKVTGDGLRARFFEYARNQSKENN